MSPVPSLPTAPAARSQNSEESRAILQRRLGAFFGCTSALLLFFIWVRWTLPRFRYDQLMRLGWIFFFELALINVFLTAFILALLPH